MGIDILFDALVVYPVLGNGEKCVSQAGSISHFDVPIN